MSPHSVATGQFAGADKIKRTSQRSVKKMKQFLRHHESVETDRFAKLALTADNDEIVLEVPLSALEQFVTVLRAVSEGKEAVLLSPNDFLSTQQVAELLNVSRPYIVKLLDNHVIPCRKVGTHRRVLLQDAQKYKQRMDSQQQAAMTFLAEKTHDSDADI